MVQKFMVEKSRVEKFIVEKSGVERFGVEKSEVEMSFNPFYFVLGHFSIVLLQD